MMWNYKHCFSVHCVSSVNSEWCDEVSNSDHWKQCLNHDQENKTVNRVLSENSTDWCLFSQSYDSWINCWWLFNHFWENIHKSQVIYWLHTCVKMQVLLLHWFQVSAHWEQTEQVHELRKSESFHELHEWDLVTISTLNTRSETHHQESCCQICEEWKKKKCQSQSFKTDT